MRTGTEILEEKFEKPNGNPNGGILESVVESKSDDPNEDILWVEYHFKDEKRQHFKSKEKRDSYENFVYGYLWYYDMVLRNGAIKHKLGFTWSSEFEYVKVFINPGPLKTSSPYKNFQDAINKFDPQQDFQLGDKKDVDNWLAPVTSSKDPQPPPPPPPPPAQ